MTITPLELAATKAYTFGRRSKWKDYIDLYFLIKKYSIAEISELASKKFGTAFSPKLFREQLIFIDDVDFSEKVEFATKEHEVNQEEVLAYFREIV